MTSKRSGFISSSTFRFVLLVSMLFILLQVGIIIAIVTYNQNVLEAQARSNARYVLNQCSIRADTEMQIADNTLKKILTQNDYLRLMASSKDGVSYHAVYAVKSLIDMSCFSDTLRKTYVVAKTDGEILIENRDNTFTFNHLSQLKGVMSEIGRDNSKSDSAWYAQQIGSSWYLAHYYVSEGVTVMAMMEIGRIWSDMLDEGYILRIRAGDHLFDIDHRGGYTEQLLTDGAASFPGNAEWVVLQSDDTPLDFAMEHRHYQSFSENTLPIFVIISSLLTLIFASAMIVFLYREYNKPIAILESATHRIKEGDYGFRAEITCRNNELQNLAASFNSMLDMILQLRISEYEQVISRQDAELKYYYIQIRPHFYLNALSSMHSMSLRGENQRISEYIMALSKNIRYMFTAGFKRVPLREELEHIDDYIRCQEILLPGCVFSYIDIAENARDWMVPQMIVHTFVENVYKHVVSIGNMITLLIRAEIIHDFAGDAEILDITIENDGDEFPDEIVEAINSGNTEAEALKNCVGLLNVHRTLCLMYGRSDLFHIKNNGSSGSKIHLYIPHDADSERKDFA